MSNTESVSLESKVKEWLKKTGYPHEMRVAQIFRKAGFYVTQSLYYPDPNTNLPREIDISASAERSDLNPYIALYFFAECKVASSKPWVVFTTFENDKTAMPINLYRLTVVPTLGHKILFDLYDDEVLQSLELIKSNHIAYGIKEAFLQNDKGSGIGHGQPSSKDIAFEALMQVTQCLSAKIAEWESYQNLPVCVLLIPLVIVDGKLFECYLDKSNREIVSEIDSCLLFWPIKTSRGISMTPITILTMRTLPSYANKVMADAELLFSYKPLIEKLLEKKKK